MVRLGVCLMCLVAVGLMGCASTGGTGGQTDYDTVWLTTLDVVSNYVTVDSVSKADGVIKGKHVTDGFRSSVTVKLVRTGDAYEPEVAAQKESHVQYFTAARKKSHETWEKVEREGKLEWDMVNELVWALAGPSTVVMTPFPNLTPEAVFEASKKSLSRHFHRIEYSDTKEGILSTERSARKSGGEMSEVRALVVVAKTAESPTVYVKVIAERPEKRWTLWGMGLNLKPGREFLGRDKVMERQIADSIQQTLAAAK